MRRCLLLKQARLSVILTENNLSNLEFLVMDEMVDILNEDGSYTGRKELKSLAHKNGLFHPTIHVWLYTRNGQLLIQKRGKNKKSYPLLWDVSVAGHIGAGEDIVTSAIREVEEEIGLELEPHELAKIGVFKSQKDHSADFRDYEFHHSFIAELKVPLNSLVRQDSEVEEIALISLVKFAEETWGMAQPEKYVPHDPEYYKTILRSIRDTLERLDEETGLA